MSASSTFLLFENFDFEKNKPFQTGWAALKTLIDESKQESEFLRAKAFFFSKHVCKFDFPKYLEWKERTKEHKTDGESSSNISEENPGESGLSVEVQPPSALNSGSTNTKELEHSEPMTGDSMKSSAATGMVTDSVGLSSSDSNIEELSNRISGLYSESETSSSTSQEIVTQNDLSETPVIQKEEDDNKLSLLDIAELIQSNKPIPGLLTLDVKPTNSDPTPSVLIRRKKPWEVESEVCRSGSIGEADYHNGIDIKDCVEVEDGSVESNNIRLNSKAID